MAAVLCRRFGLEHIEAAEDLVGEIDFAPATIADSRLAMIFAVCDPQGIVP